MKTPPDQFAVDKIRFLLDLPPAEHWLIFCARGGRRIRLDRSPVMKLTLTLDGPWSEDEKARISGLLAEESSSRTDLRHLRDAEDPLRGLVFSDENYFSASAVIHRIADEVLGVNPARLPVKKSYDDHDARPEIARRLRKDYSIEILHEESGVRVWARIWGRETYSLSVPVACLDASRGQRERAKQSIADAGWRAYDGDLGPEPTVGEDDEIWGYLRDHGGAQAAADQALRLLCEIADLPINSRVSLGPVPEGDAPNVSIGPPQEDLAVNMSSVEKPTVSTTEPEDAAQVKDPYDQPLLGCGLFVAVLIIVLDFFDVSVFDGRGPGACVLILGLGILALVVEGLTTGGLPIVGFGGFILRKPLAPIFWISIAIYAMGGIVLSTVGILMISGFLPS